MALGTLASYAVIYTPLKRRTFVRHGHRRDSRRAAAGHRLGRGARTTSRRARGCCSGFVFLWQLPHFLAIAWIYREDYARAGLPMLPVIEPDGRSTGRQAVVYSAALLPLAWRRRCWA